MKKITVHASLVLLIMVCIIAPAFAAKLPVSLDSAVAAKPAAATINDALKDFNALSRHDRKLRFKEMKKTIRQYKEDKKAGKDVDSDTVLQVILGIFLPPLGVYLHEGDTNNKFWISVLLTVLGLLIFGFAGVIFLGTLPSIVYALVVILSK